VRLELEEIEMSQDFNEFAAMLRTIMERADSGDVAEDDLGGLCGSLYQCATLLSLRRKSMLATQAGNLTRAAKMDAKLTKTRLLVAKFLDFRGYTDGPLKDNR
jgi:hypothetical protein